MSIHLTLLVSSLKNLASCLLFFTIVLVLSYINFSLIMILTVKEAWSDRLCKSGKMVCVSNSFALAQRNIMSIMELNLLELSIYLIRICAIDIDNFRLNKSATFLRVSACIKWWGYDGSQSLSLILKSLIIMRVLFKFTSVSFRYFKTVC